METKPHPEAGVDYPRNWHKLLAWFPDDAACLPFLERLRWAKGFTCRFCGTVQRRLVADDRRPAALPGVSRRDVGDRGDDLGRTRTPLVSWFAAVWLSCSSGIPHALASCLSLRSAPAAAARSGSSRQRA